MRADDDALTSFEKLESFHFDTTASKTYGRPSSSRAIIIAADSRINVTRRAISVIITGVYAPIIQAKNANINTPAFAPPRIRAAPLCIKPPMPPACASMRTIAEYDEARRHA